MKTIIDIEVDIFKSLSKDHQDLLCSALERLEGEVLPEDAWSHKAISSALSAFGGGALLVVDGIDGADVGLLDWDKVFSGEIYAYCVYQQVFELAEIHRIGTHPGYQRQGLASLLMTGLVERLSLKKADFILLEVRADNHKAISFYEKVGFVQIDQRKGYYQTADGRIDALILQRNLV